MKRSFPWRRRLGAALVYVAAALLLLEQWLWNVGARLMALAAAVLPLAGLERRIRALPPFAALCVFLLPGLLLFPVKIIALLAIAHGHAAAGICTIVAAKVAGAAAVARLYALTLPALLTMAWFAWGHARFLVLRERWIALLRASGAWRALRRLTGRIDSWRRALLAGMRRARPASDPGKWYTVRLLRRMAARWRRR